MIAVTFALKSESSDFVRLLHHGSLHNREVAVLHTGVGEKVARSHVADFLKARTPQLLISAGFAGALNDTCRPGELFLAENFSSPNAYRAAQTALPKAQSGRLRTVTAVVDSPAGRTEIARLHSADAVDMETAFIAETCAERSIPMLSLRVISDTPSYAFPAPAAVLFDIERQRTNYARLCLYIARNPKTLGRLTRFARQIATARAALAEGLEVLLRSGAF